MRLFRDLPVSPRAAVQKPLRSVLSGRRGVEWGDVDRALSVSGWHLTMLLFDNYVR